ncbi:MAG TPA: alpha/beta hydrolase [Chloroflexota bacterium]|nr:alpha/beta hydrolase [Chloroflexota bacterium]
MGQPTEVMHSRWTSSGGLPLHARVAEQPGTEGHPPIVLVHGLVMSSRYLLPTARLLAPRWRVHVPDLPGYGKSGKPDHALDVVELAEALAAYLAAVEIPRAALVANSLGCQIAAEFAARHPAQAVCLVLLGPTVDPRSRPVINLLLRWLMNVPLEPPSLHLVAIRDVLDMGPLRSYQTLRHMMRHHIESTLPLVAAPTLVVRGSRDSTVTREWAEQVVSLLPRGRLAEIPGAPHTINYNSPERTVALVNAFVRASCSTASGVVMQDAG